MMGRIFGMAAAVSLAAVSVASANPIQLTGIAPPGTGATARALLNSIPLSVFASGGQISTGSGGANNMGGDLATLIGAVNPQAGQVYVLSVDTPTASGNFASLVVLAGGSISTNFMVADGTIPSAAPGGLSIFQTGGLTVSSSTSAPGSLAFHGGLAAIGGFSSFAVANIPMYSGGSLTIQSFGGAGAIPSNATVNFLSWDGTAFQAAGPARQMSGSSLSFTFEVVPVPAPAALAGLGLIGAGLLRRRMAKN